MTDLTVHTGILRTTARDLTDAVEVAHEVHSRGDSLRALGENAGHPTANGAIDHFLSRWSYGMGLIGDDASNLAQMLGTAADAYEQLEQALGKAYR
jgi:hypothetical protein